MHIDGPVGVLVLDRPENHNGLDAAMVAQLCEVTAWLADRAPLRALVVTGTGRTFCAGGDVALFRELVERPDVDAASEVRGWVG